LHLFTGKHICGVFYSWKFKAALAFEKAYADVKKAFQYYLDHYNLGRPIIIASHSQGTIHAARLLKDFFDGKNYKNSLFVPMLLGCQRQNIISSLFLPVQTVRLPVVSLAGEHIKEAILILLISPRKILKVWLPIHWAGLRIRFFILHRKLGRGVENFNTIKKAVVNTNIHGNVLWSSKPSFFGNIFLTKKNYHIADINLFYMNIRQNITVRLRSYLNSIKNWLQPILLADRQHAFDGLFGSNQQWFFHLYFWQFIFHAEV